MCYNSSETGEKGSRNMSKGYKGTKSTCIKPGEIFIQHEKFENGGFTMGETWEVIETTRKLIRFRCGDRTITLMR